MGFWDFFQPGDLRHYQPSDSPNTPSQVRPRLLEESISQKTPDVLRLPLPQSQPRPPLRENRNAKLFLAGSAFFAFSILLTRRAFARRRLQNQLSQLTAVSEAQGGGAATKVAQAQAQAPPPVPAMEALEALNIATINVISVAMMATGGTLYYLNINTMEEARRFIRGGLGVDGTGRSEEEADQEIEGWIASVLSRKDAKKDQAEIERDELERLRRENERLKKR